MRQGKYTVVSGKYVHSSMLAMAYAKQRLSCALCGAIALIVCYAAYILS